MDRFWVLSQRLDPRRPATAAALEATIGPVENPFQPATRVGWAR
jgi:hypothetical protein